MKAFGRYLINKKHFTGSSSRTSCEKKINRKMKYFKCNFLRAFTGMHVCYLPVICCSTPFAGVRERDCVIYVQ